MILYLFTIYDKAADNFCPPFTAKNYEVGKREFMEIVNNKQTTIHRYPDQFSLHFIGTFNDATGVIQQDKQEHLGVASQYLQREEPQIPPPAVDLTLETGKNAS